MPRPASVIGVLCLVASGCRSPAPKPTTPVVVVAGAPAVVDDAGTSVATPVASADAAAPEAAEPPPYDVAGELAWARTRWPRELGKVDTGAPFEAFRDWVAPDTTIPVWVTTPAYSCKRATLSRAAGDVDSLALTVFTKETAKLREYDTASAGSELFLGGSGGSEIRDANGTWQTGGAWSKSEQGSWGHLSKVGADFAQFAGVWVDIAASCAGAETKLPCAKGETVSCSACTDVAIAVTHRQMGMVRYAYAAKLPPLGCPRCEVKTNPDLDRVTALLGNLDAWVLELPKSSTIYRSLAACAKKLQ